MTPERVLELKRDAAALHQRTGIKHTAALAQIAQAEGYASWKQLLLAAGGADAIRAERDMIHNPAELERALRRNERAQRVSSFTCPRCGRVSFNPNDIRERYCGACRDWIAP